MPMVRPCENLAHTSYGIFVPTPLGETAAKNIGLSMKALRVLSINGGRVTAFVDPRSLLPVPWNYEAPGIVCHHVSFVSLKVQGPWIPN